MVLLQKPQVRDARLILSYLSTLLALLPENKKRPYVPIKRICHVFNNVVCLWLPHPIYSVKKLTGAQAGYHPTCYCNRTLLSLYICQYLLFGVQRRDTWRRSITRLFVNASHLPSACKPSCCFGHAHHSGNCKEKNQTP